MTRRRDDSCARYNRRQIIFLTFSPTARTDAYIVFDKEIKRLLAQQLVFGFVATPTPLNRVSISCNFLIVRYLAFADSAFVQPCYRADNNSILMSTWLCTRTHAYPRSRIAVKNANDVSVKKIECTVKGEKRVRSLLSALFRSVRGYIVR